VPPDSVRCTRELDAELATFGTMGGHSAIIHRTVSGVTPDCLVCQRSNDYFALTVDCNRIKCATVRARVRARAEGAPDTLQDLSGAPPDSPEAPPVRAPTVRTQRSADAPDCPVRHATDSLPTTTFGGWGYKYPNHPHIQASKFSTFLLLTRASIQYKTHQRDQILSQLHTKL
jgi:hypothetical protein